MAHLRNPGVVNADPSEGVPLRWGVLGAGTIARRFASQLAYSNTGRLAGVGSREPGKAASFAAEFGAQVAAFGSYQELLASDDIDAVYIATPHTHHVEWTVKAAEAGKHILCEKPLGVTEASARTAVEAARRCGVVLLEGYMYRFHPQIDTLLDLITSGAIGRLLHIDASFSFQVPLRSGRLFDEALAGGGILDVGGYPVSMARMVASAGLGVPSEPISFSGGGFVGDTRVDEWAVASLQFDGGITANVRCGVGLSDEEGVTIYGSEGMLRVHTPWVVDPDLPPRITVRRAGQPQQVLECDAGSEYAAEADALAAAVASLAAGGSGDVPRMTPEDTLANLRVLDAWREAVGLKYSFERSDQRSRR